MIHTFQGVMVKRLLQAAFLGLAFLITGCATKTPKDMSALEKANPRSILVVPVVNRSLDVDAPNYVLSTLPVPVAEKGYYVFPVNTTKVVLEQEGLYEGDKIHEQPPEQLAKLFGADAVLYVRINQWGAKYAVLTTVVTVDFDYWMTGKDGEVLWNVRKRMQWQPNNNNNSGASPMGQLLAQVITAAMARAAPNYMPLTRQANQEVFILGQSAIPDGPHRLKPAPK